MKKRWQMICICYAAVAAVLLAAGIRAITQQDKEESMKKADKKAELIRKLQEELDQRTQVEEEAIRLMENCEFEKAQELLGSLDDSIVKEIERELEQLDADSGKTSGAAGWRGESVAEIKPDYEIELSKEMVEEESEHMLEVGQMKTAWYIEQDLDEKAIRIRPGSDSCISLNGAHDARFFIEIVGKDIQEILQVFQAGGFLVEKSGGAERNVQKWEVKRGNQKTEPGATEGQQA